MGKPMTPRPRKVTFIALSPVFSYASPNSVS
jgi:hypothetical protein